MFYDLGILSKQKANDLGILNKQSVKDIGIIIKPEKFIYILITEDDYVLITEDNLYKIMI